MKPITHPHLVPKLMSGTVPPLPICLLGMQRDFPFILRAFFKTARKKKLPLYGYKILHRNISKWESMVNRIHIAECHGTYTEVHIFCSVMVCSNKMFSHIVTPRYVRCCVLTSFVLPRAKTTQHSKWI